MQCVEKSARGNSHRRWMQWAVVATALLSIAQPAYSFFPFGGFRADGDVTFLRWPLGTLDRNDDGDVSGDGDGAIFTIRNGEFGYNNAEIPVLIDSFNVWENLPGSYIAFTFTQPVSGPIFFGVTDGFSSVTINIDEEMEGVDPSGVAGIALPFGFIEDFFITVPNLDVAVQARGGEIYEADIILFSSFFRDPQGETDNLDFMKGVMVHEIGHAIGMGHNPMHNFNNLDELLELDEDDELPDFPQQEDAIISLRDGGGVLRTVGVTPTMHPFIFGTLDPLTEQFYAGQRDLAHDDIAMAHFLYPRQGQLDDYFTIHSQARRGFPGLEGVPSPMIIGGLVTAYVDHDNNAGTGRVPLISTMTGLYTNGANNGNVDLDGRFSIYGLPKQLESSSGTLFDASYTFTLTRVGDSYPFQSPGLVDTMHGFNPGVDDRAGELYDNSFISEVFNENGNLLDSTQSLAGGTPLKFDNLRRQIVSVDSGLTLDQILVGAKPMFGPSVTDSTCPLDIIFGTEGFEDIEGGFNNVDFNGFSLPTTQLGMTGKIRSFRDTWMMNNPAGRLAEDGYYRIAPVIGNFLNANRAITDIIRSIVSFLLMNCFGVLSFWAVAILAAALAWSRQRKKIARLAIRWMGVGAILIACYPAQATTLVLQSTSQLTQGSSNIVQGTVIAKNTYVSEMGRILTDVLIETNDVLKGTLNKGNTITLTILGGNLNGYVAFVPGFPTYKVDEEVVLFLKETKTKGLVVTGAEQGKLTVHTDPDTGEKFVRVKSLRSKQGLPTAERDDPDEEIAKDDEGDLVEPQGLVSLDQYTDYLRGLIAKQARAEED